MKQEGTDKQSNFFTFETVELKKFHSALSRSAFTELAAQPRKVELLTCHPFCQICGKRGQIILLRLRVLLLAPKTTRSSLHSLITLLKRGCKARYIDNSQELCILVNGSLWSSFSCWIYATFREEKVPWNVSRFSATFLLFLLQHYFWLFTFCPSRTPLRFNVQSRTKKFERIFNLAQKKIRLYNLFVLFVIEKYRSLYFLYNLLIIFNWGIKSKERWNNNYLAFYIIEY